MQDLVKNIEIRVKKEEDIARELERWQIKTKNELEHRQRAELRKIMEKYPTESIYKFPESFPIKERISPLKRPFKNKNKLLDMTTG